jgi:hypothetical protein
MADSEEGEAAAETQKPSIAVAKPPQPVVIVPSPPPPSPPPVARPDPVIRPTDTDLLVQEFARLRRLPPAELIREQEAARNAFTQSRSDSARVRYAMAVAVPGTPGSDDARALELLEPLAKTPGASLHALAFLLTSYIQEQRRLHAQLAGLQQNVQGLQQNVQALQQKLDALKTLERSLSEREAGTMRRR